MKNVVTRSYFFGFTIAEGFSTVLLSISTAFVVFHSFHGTTIWGYWALALFFFILIHMWITANRFVVVPEFISLMACLGWVLAPWLAYKFPPSFDMFRMSVPRQEYLSYNVPCVAALWFGLHLPIRYKSTVVHGAAFQLTKKDARIADAMIFLGLVISLISDRLPQGLNFFYYILSNLRFVGLFMMLVGGFPGWRWRTFVILAGLFSNTASYGVFYEFFLWSGYLLICLAYFKRWRLRLLLSLFLAIFMVTSINTVKFRYRHEIENHAYTQTERLKLLGHMVLSFWQGSDEYKTFTVFNDRLVRWNQGWIIAKVMATVPRKEPYANGETILSAFNASFLPRILSPKKENAASQALFERYTGIRLPYGTTMTLSIAGEMYANFGKYFGIFAVGVYGFCIGLIFNKFARLAEKNPIWWAWLPFVMISAMVAEWNLVDILNQVAKSAFVMWVLIKTIPFFKHQMSRSRLASVKARRG